MDLTMINVSERFWWSESTDEFWDSRTNQPMSDKSYGAKVSVFEDRELAWFLNVAQSLIAKGPSPADYVALSIAVAYIESIQLFREGKPSGDSKRLFRASAQRIFFPQAALTDKPTLTVIDRLWKDVRNGLFHSGFTIGKTNLDYSLAVPLELSKQGLLKINPQAFVDSTVDDFRKYVQELRENPAGKLGMQFEKLWNKRWEKW